LFVPSHDCHVFHILLAIVRYIDARQVTLCVQLDNPSSYDTSDKVHCFTASVDPAFCRVRRLAIEY
jgi:hypothetical protein